MLRKRQGPLARITVGRWSRDESDLGVRYYRSSFGRRLRVPRRAVPEHLRK